MNENIESNWNEMNGDAAAKYKFKHLYICSVYIVRCTHTDIEMSKHNHNNKQ